VKKGVGYPLSQSLFMRGLQCHKALWLHVNQPELAAAPDEGLLARFEEGVAVGKIAHQLFPKGRNIRQEVSTFPHQLWLTKQLMAYDVPALYESAFHFDGVTVFPDILRRDRDGWSLYAVKSQVDVYPGTIRDVALQYYVLHGCGVALKRVYVVHIHSGYVRGDHLDLSRLFTQVDVTKEVLEKQRSIEDHLRSMRASLRQVSSPHVGIGGHCYKPGECDFKSHCWEDSPDSIFAISGLNKSEKFRLFSQGIKQMKELPPHYELTLGQKNQVRAHLTQDVYVDFVRLKQFLGTLHYPLCFLDFESAQSAIPLFKGSKPFEQTPFQFSLHIQLAPDEPLQYVSFLHETEEDPRFYVAKALCEALPKKACIVTYNHHLESQTLMDFGERFPEFKSVLMDHCKHIRDLMDPFEKGWVYSPAMRGRFSIKAILPALVPDLSYDHLVIKNGETAARSFYKLLRIQDEERHLLRQALEAYGKMDTLAMVRILDVLRGYVVGK
jgi:hypothetical protein